jgi:GT2 family glycosyltransferase
MNADGMPMASVIVVNYNGKQYLKRCLDALLGQTYPSLEIILVDNGSSDGSVEFARACYPTVMVIENGENLGFAIANNIGIRIARGEFIATLNNDTEVMPGWIEAMVKVAASNEFVGMCASKMLFMKNPDIIDSTGLCISRSGACWDRSMFERDNGQFDKMEEVFGPCAGAAIYKRKMLEEIGLFDEDFFAYMEDVDLAFRGRLAGWKCIYVPDAVVYHVHGGTAGYGSDFTVYYGNRNIVWNAVKNNPVPLLITSLPFIIGRNLGVIPYYIFRGYSKTIIRSKIDAIKGIPGMFAKRKRVNSTRRKINGFIKTWASMPAVTEDDRPGAKSIADNIDIVK